MKQLNYSYTSKKEFLEYLHDNSVALFDDKIFIQMFTSIEDKEVVQAMATDICAIVPNAKLIGCSTAGEVLGSKMHEKSVILSISIFEKTIPTVFYAEDEDSYSLGQKVANELIQKDTKCIISFLEGLSHIGEEYLNGFSNSNPSHVLITGGMAADLYTFKETFVICNNKLYTKGAVAVALNGDDLEAYTDYNLGWRAVGPSFTITKADGNRVYEIDNKPIKMHYTEILGEEVVQNLPASAIEFPLIKQENGVTIARSVVQASKDGSISYAGLFHKGDIVRFGLGSTQLVNQYHPEENANINNNHFQAGFIYSCAARKQFLSSELEKSFAIADSIAPTAGCFTYGEFYNSSKKAVLLNITTTLLYLFEKGTQSSSREKIVQQGSQPSKPLTESASLHLIDFISKNFQEQQSIFQAEKFNFHEFLEAINSIVIISRSDLQGNIIYANEEFEKISGYKQEELLGHSHNIVRSPDTDIEVFKDLWATIKKGKVWHGELANRAKDGSTYYVKSHIFPITDQKHNIIEYLAIREDITDVVKSKKAYENQLKFSNMLLNNEENVVVVTENNQITKVNDAFFRTFDYKDIEDFQSRNECICDLFIKKEGYLKKEEKPTMWYDTILNEPHKIYFALMVDAKDNERIYSVKSRQLLYNNETTYTIHTFNDITELEHAKEQAQQAEAAQAMFLANMSHEIRTPMNGILGFAELLQHTELSDTQKKYVDIVNSSTRTLLNIINDILDSSKIANNKIELETIDINPFVELDTTFELLKSLAAQKSLIYINKLDTKMFECIESDATRLRQIITNLLSNAIKFTPKNGQVVFQTEVIKEENALQTVRFYISDTGIGIPEEKLAKIFKPFSQADESTTRKFGGTGLGLSISADLVKVFGSELQVKSIEGEGSTFFFDLEFYRCDKSTILKNLLVNYEIIIVEADNNLVTNTINKTLDSFDVPYKHISKENEFTKVLKKNSIVLTLDAQIGMQIRKTLPREQIVCITDKCDNEHLDCIDLTFDESFGSHLYNFLLTKMQNYTLVAKENLDSGFSKNVKILIAEDYEINRMLMESLLDKYPNISYEFAHDGEKAIVKAVENSYDIIFMDVNMPNKNGLEATKIIRQRVKQHIPIIALTANALKGDKERFLEAGMDDYISKPIELKELKRVLMKYATNEEKEEEEVILNFQDLIETIKSRLELNDTIIIKLLTVFVKDLKLSVKEFEDAFKKSDTERILHLAHKIKGSSSTLTLDKLANMMLNIENDIQNNINFEYNNILKIIESYITLLQKGLKNV